MATKNHPGAFNCYVAALPDEEIFTILARDPAGPATLHYWINKRIECGKDKTPDDIERIEEARAIAARMSEWRIGNSNPTGDGPTWQLPRPDGMDDGPAIRLKVEEAESSLQLQKILVGLQQIAAGIMDDDGLMIDAPQVGKRIAKQINDYTIEMLQIVGEKAPVAASRGLESATLKPPVATSELPDYGRVIVGEMRPQDATRIAELEAQIENLTTTPKAQSPIVDEAPDDLAQAPEVPPHRFSQFTKGTRYAYARGLEVAPAHLPKALDEMVRDGWLLHSIFGKTDSQNIGFIFERYIPSALDMAHGFIDNPDATNDMNWAVEEFLSGKPLEDILASHGGLDR